jgi:hypothetical protein
VRPPPGTPPLALERAGLTVLEHERAVYEELVREIRARAAPGSPIYAAPDCPEVYFLADRPNPTRTMYEVLAAQPLAAPEVMGLIATRNVPVVVLHARPLFSPPLAGELVAALRHAFPQARVIGPFELRWK